MMTVTSHTLLNELCESMEVSIACEQSSFEDVGVNGHVLSLAETHTATARSGQWALDGQPVERAALASALGIEPATA